MPKILRSIALLISMSSVCTFLGATPITLTLQGEWIVEDNAVIRTPDRQVQSVPITFTATVLFDPAKAKEYYNALPSQYSTQYGNPVMTTSVLDYAPKNTLPNFFLNTTSLLSQTDSNTFLQPTPYEYFQFSSSASAYQTTAGYTNSWTQYFSFFAGYNPISKSDIGFVDGNDFTALLFESMNSHQWLSSSFQSFKYGYANGLPISYSEGFTLFGHAQIVGITEIPEPNTFFLFIAAAIAVCTSRRRANS